MEPAYSYNPGEWHWAGQKYLQLNKTVTDSATHKEMVTSCCWLSKMMAE